VGPLPGVTVTLIREDGQPAVTATDGTGAYLFTDLARGVTRFR
jgi:hypothetical protein